MRTRELRELSDEELDRRLATTREELFNLRFQAATGALDNTARLGLTKRDIARIMTIRAERANRLERR
jgi:large subunit ribosomal protein L29